MRLENLPRAAAWSVALLSAASAVVAWSDPMPVTPAGITANAGGTAPSPPLVPLRSVDSAAAALRDRNPFRLHRTPALVRFGHQPEPVHEVEAPPPPPLPLVLAGIVGPPWVALIEGVPGSEPGILLPLGGEASGLRITAIRGDTVVVASPDTTWTLTLKRPW